MFHQHELLSIELAQTRCTTSTAAVLLLFAAHLSQLTKYRQTSILSKT